MSPPAAMISVVNLGEGWHTRAPRYDRESAARRLVSAVERA